MSSEVCTVVAMRVLHMVTHLSLIFSADEPAGADDDRLAFDLPSGCKDIARFLSRLNNSWQKVSQKIEQGFGQCHVKLIDFQLRANRLLRAASRLLLENYVNGVKVLCFLVLSAPFGSRKLNGQRSLSAK